MALRGLALVVLAVSVAAQSNYANHGNSIEYSGTGLPEQATLDGKVTKLDDLSPVIFLNRTKAALNCAAGSMEAELKFEEPFYGIAFADFNRNSPCFVAGNGNSTYKIEMPLKGCGTVQNPQRVFTNNIVVRFHPNLEMDGDEVITIVCRYPPPIAPPPPAPPQNLLAEPILPVEAPLKGFQVMLIVCAIFFLTLVLLGLAASYYCLSRRRVAVIRRVPMALSLAGSDITKMSESSISMFEGLKIPRATVTPVVVVGSSISGSEAQLIIDDQSDTLPSDYPSESPSSAHSEVEAITTRQAASEVSSIYDASACADESLVLHADSRVPPPPQFDVSVRVKRVAPSPPPRASSISCSSRGSTPPPPLPVMPVQTAVADVATAEAMRVQERNLTTILEREDQHAAEATPTMRTTAHLAVQPPIQPTVTITTRPPVYSRILRRQKSDDSSVAAAQVKLQRRDSLNTLNTENTDTHSVNEVLDDGLATIELEPPVVAVHKPEITQHVVDDVFLRTITEKRIIEDIERRTREVTEFHARVQPQPQFDVAIRTYPDPNAVPDWDRYSTASSSTMISEPKESYRSSMNIPVPAEPIRNWDVLIRVLEVPEAEPNLISPALVSKANEIHVDDDRGSVCSSATSVLTDADREKWRQIITTESTLRTLLTEATVREDYERIRHDQRYERLFEPQKWDVIIRVLAPPEEEPRLRKGSAASWDNRSRRSSLPTLYEFDSDAASTHTSGAAGAERVMVVGKFDRRSSYRSDGVDMRSMSEFTCNDFVAPARAESDVSGHYDDPAGSLMRSASQPSLARSASEFTERRWAVESNMMASSPEQTPVLARRAKSSDMLLVASTSSSFVASSSSVHHHQYHHHDRWGADSESSYK